MSDFGLKSQIFCKRIECPVRILQVHVGFQMGGKGHVVVSLLLFMLNNRMIIAGPLYRNEVTGSIWGESGAAAITGPLDPGVSDEELDGTRRLGERVARITKKIKNS
jgi:hypothetical protein